MDLHVIPVPYNCSIKVIRHKRATGVEGLNPHWHALNYGGNCLLHPLVVDFKLGPVSANTIITSFSERQTRYDLQASQYINLLEDFAHSTLRSRIYIQPWYLGHKRLRCE